MYVHPYGPFYYAGLTRLAAADALLLRDAFASLVVPHASVVAPHIACYVMLPDMASVTAIGPTL